MSWSVSRSGLLAAGVLLALNAAAAETGTSLTVYSSAQPGGIPAEWYRPLPGMGTPMAKSSFVVLASILVIGYALARNGLWQRLWTPMPAPVRGFAMASLMTAAMVLAPDAGKMFVYFVF